MGKFQKGQSRPDGAGRKTGTPNKVNADTKYAVADLIAGNMPKLQIWLDKVAENDPAKAFDLLVKMMEFSIPKLSRTEYRPPHEAAPERPKIVIEYIQSRTTAELVSHPL